MNKVAAVEITAASTLIPLCLNDSPAGNCWLYSRCSKTICERPSFFSVQLPGCHETQQVFKGNSAGIILKHSW